MIDPARPRRNAVPPPVHIEQVVADRRPYPATGVVRLPPLTRDLEIDYAGLSFIAPQKMLFRYRLEGREEAWQEPGTRRQAFYTDLRPGTYRFHVIASNNDGLWNEAGAALDFVVAPAWYQGRAFVVIAVMTAFSSCGECTGFDCARSRRLSTRVLTSDWRNERAWHAISTTPCCKPSRQARWSRMPHSHGATTPPGWRA